MRPRSALLAGLSIAAATGLAAPGCWLVVGIDDKVLVDAGPPPVVEGGPDARADTDADAEVPDAACPEGFATCDTTAPCAAHFADDPANCGRCDRACQGCAAAKCPVVALIAAGNGVQFLTAYQGDVIWASADPPAVLAANKVTGGPGWIDVDPGNLPRAVVVVDGLAYYTVDTDGLIRASVPDGYVNAATQQWGAGPIVGDGTALFYGRRRWGPQDPAGIWSLALDGGAPVPIAPGLSNDPGGMALDGAYVYWVESAQGGGIYRSSRAAPATELVAQVNGATPRVAVDQTAVYFADGSGGNIQAVAKGQVGATILASGQTNVVDLATDGYAVFWTAGDDSTGYVFRVNRDGSRGVEVLADGQKNVGPIVVDGYNVYWVADDDAGTPTIFRTNK